MKKFRELFVIILFVIFSKNIYSQIWSWEGGRNDVCQPGCTDSITGGRFEAAIGYSNGNLILYGGTSSYSYSTNYKTYGAIWEFNTNTKLWSRIGGSAGWDQLALNSNEGSTSAFSTSNNSPRPGARKGCAYWSTNNGELYIYGGYGLGFYYSTTNPRKGLRSDLWKINTINKTWTFIKGSSWVFSEGNYGTAGIPTATNNPGARQQSANWVGKDGKLWMFGGNKWDSLKYPQNPYEPILGDLWVFDTLTNYWTYVKGWSSTYNKNGIFGNVGIPSELNKPGCRKQAMTWADKDGNLWLFGGYGFPCEGFASSYLNDLWKYSPITNQWTYIKGDCQGNKLGIYGIKDVFSFSNKPGSRVGGVTWVDNQGNLYLYGGYGYSAISYLGHLNDLWKFDVSKSQWAWISGDTIYNQNGIYGTQGVFTINNKPGSRFLASGIRTSQDNNSLWLIGGYGFANNNTVPYPMSDVWKYRINTLTSVTDFTFNDNIIISPNPANDYIKIISENDNNIYGCNVEIRDMNGKIHLYLENYNNGKMPLHNLLPGIYIIRIQTLRGNKFYLKKLIKS